MTVPRYFNEDPFERMKFHQKLRGNSSEMIDGELWIEKRTYCGRKFFVVFDGEESRIEFCLQELRKILSPFYRQAFNRETINQLEIDLERYVEAVTADNPYLKKPKIPRLSYTAGAITLMLDF